MALDLAEYRRKKEALGLTDYQMLGYAVEAEFWREFLREWETVTIPLARRVARGNEMFFEACEAYNALEKGQVRPVEQFFVKFLCRKSNRDLLAAFWEVLHEEDPDTIFARLRGADRPAAYLNAVLNNKEASICEEREGKKRLESQFPCGIESMKPARLEAEIEERARLNVPYGQDPTLSNPGETVPRKYDARDQALTKLESNGRAVTAERVRKVRCLRELGGGPEEAREILGPEGWRALKTAVGAEYQRVLEKNSQDFS